VNIFVWGKDVERAVSEVREYAERQENWYRPGADAEPPGKDANYVVWAGTIRAVFSWTVAPFGVLRHLTVSAGEGKSPRPEACWTIAHYFGFTGAPPAEHGLFRHPGPEWLFDIDNTSEEKCIVIQQLVEGASDAPAPSVVH
jgi:hypothetical protein